MRVTINHQNFKKALGIINKIVSKNPSLPILNNVLIKTENGRLKISATNLEIGINYFIGVKIDEVGQIAVPIKILSDFILNLIDEKITLLTKNNILNINSNKYKTQILSFDTKDFPIIPKIKDNLLCVLPINLIKNSFTSIFDSIALSETRPELTGVFIKFDNKNIIFASTDSFRLTEKIIDFKTLKLENLILPRNTVVELIRIANDLDGDFNIYLKDNQIAFSNDDFELVSRIIDGNYPDYKKIIPDKYISRVVIDKDVFEKNIRLAGLFSSDISDIKLSCSDNKIIITSKNSSKGEIEVSLDSMLKNEPFEILLNYQYLLDGLKKMPTDKVILDFTGVGSPLILRPAENKKELLYLIMPFRK